MQSKEDSDLREQLLSGTTLNAKERICTVDENNNPTEDGHDRSEMRLNNLWHRATYVVVRHEPPAGSEDGNKVKGQKTESFLLVQRRSAIKDYCPNKLDATPGGVVGYGETYEENATREIMEEMGIDVTLLPNTLDESSEERKTQNTMKKLFVFPYQDERVRVWGGMFEVVYKGRLDQVRIQEEEVSEVLRLSLREVQRMSDTEPEDWMPDSLHAMKLYLQHRTDQRLKRRLSSRSSSDLEAYGLRPKPQAIFFDCDDTLYFDEWTVAKRLTEKIDDWCVNRAGLPRGEAYQLYKRHGTAIRGLLAEGHLEHCDDTIDAFLREVHDLPIAEMLERDQELYDMIERIDPTIPKYIFTASVRHHAERCLDALGIRDHFVDIIDTKACNLRTKHCTSSFEIAMKMADVDDPEACVFLDDSTKNIEAAAEIGWRSILVGRYGRDCGKEIDCEHAEHQIGRIHEMPDVLPELFDVQ